MEHQKSFAAETPPEQLALSDMTAAALLLAEGLCVLVEIRPTIRCSAPGLCLIPGAREQAMPVETTGPEANP